MDDTASCPCGRGDAYASCCGPLHEGNAAAPTAERLMRSRYSAFVLELRDYLLDTWASSTRPGVLEFDAGLAWKRLVVEHVDRGGPFDVEGEVTFIAVGRTPAGRFEQRERSRFVREQGRWRYLDGFEPPA